MFTTVAETRTRNNITLTAYTRIKYLYLFYRMCVCVCALQVRTLFKAHRQSSHFGVVFGHLEPGSVDGICIDHVRDRFVHVADRENQV